MIKTVKVCTYSESEDGTTSTEIGSIIYNGVALSSSYSNIEEDSLLFDNLVSASIKVGDQVIDPREDPGSWIDNACKYYNSPYLFLSEPIEEVSKELNEAGMDNMRMGVTVDNVKETSKQGCITKKFNQYRKAMSRAEAIAKATLECSKVKK
jgi:mevalonate kinase